MPRIAILLDGNGAFQPAYAVGYKALPNGTLTERSLTLKRLQQTPHTLVEFDDAQVGRDIDTPEEYQALVSEDALDHDGD